MKKFLIFVVALVLFLGPMASVKVEANQAAIPPTVAKWLFEWMAGQILDRTCDAVFGGGRGGTKMAVKDECTVTINGQVHEGDQITCISGRYRCEPIACNGWLRYEFN